MDTEKNKWGIVALVILAADIIGAAIACIVISQNGINWPFIGGALAEVALVALLCGVVRLLDSIDTTLKVLGASLFSKQ